MTRKLKKAITIKDVAAKARVSISTASRALHGRGYASVETRRQVRACARELGYKPHAAARSLKLRRTNTVGLMIADIVNPFFSYLAAGVLDCAKGAGYHVVLCATDEDQMTEREYLEVLMQERVDGIIAVPTGHNESLWRSALELGTILVLLDRELPGISEADTVLVDNVKGAYDATNYLLGLGHRRIGMITGPLSTTTGKGRIQGYYDAFKAASLPVDQELVQIGSFKRESGVQAIENLLVLANPPTAIFATNNVLGEAALFGIRGKGLNIPDDFSFVQFDEVPWACLTTPQVTVVAQPTYDLGFVGMQRLTLRLQEPEKTTTAPLRTVLQPQLIIRQSCIPHRISVSETPAITQGF
jgi:LacI family transcriptional regulator